MIVEALLGIALMIFIAYMIVYATQGEASYQGDTAIFDLNQQTPKEVLSNKFLSWSNKPCAVRFGIFIQNAPRTLSKVDCITQPTAGGAASSFGPNCTNYEYDICDCSGSACTNCNIVDNNTYLSKLLSIDNKLELWASGYTSQTDKPYVPALLKVQTAKNDSDKYVEAIPLPTIPLQKWVIITIVKQGRRFDVYYGQELVASKILNYVPVPPEGNRNWMAGHKLWKGQIGFFNGVNDNWSKFNVQSDVKQLVNTRGVPFYLDQIPIDFKTMFTIPSCPFGNCNPLPTIKPRNPFEVYNTNMS